MRPFLIGLTILSAAVVLVVACGQGPAGPTTGTASSGGTGGAPNCEGVYVVFNDKDGGSPCDICMHENCCAELSNCRDYACIVCANYSSGMGCTYRSKYVEECADTRCLSTCSPGPPHLTSSASAGGSTTGGG